ncbi:MAG: serine hydrolase [Rhodospirillaceae bacterium]|nr:serine hydrolase [Rhodospirillaceae bacterium]
MDTRPGSYDFAPMDEAVQKYLDDDFLAMASSLILKGGEPVDFRLWGHQDREAGIPVAADSIYRIYSNTKIVTSVAAMTLWEQGRFDIAAILFTQRMPGFWHAFSHEYKRQVYAAVMQKVGK